MSTKHTFTPGPWIAEQNGELTDRDWTVGKLLYCVADVGNEADARLIAAAPELLAALRLLLGEIDYTQGNCRVNEMVGAVLDRAVLERCHAAIARAEQKGETRA